MIIDKAVEKCCLKKLTLHSSKNWRYDGAWVSGKVIFNGNNRRGGAWREREKRAGEAEGREVKETEKWRSLGSMTFRSPLRIILGLISFHCYISRRDTVFNLYSSWTESKDVLRTLIENVRTWVMNWSLNTCLGFIHESVCLNPNKDISSQLRSLKRPDPGIIVSLKQSFSLSPVGVP